MRAFRLPEDADVDKIDARYENGMLNVKIARIASPKAPDTKAIQVK